MAVPEGWKMKRGNALETFHHPVTRKPLLKESVFGIADWVKSQKEGKI